MLSVNAADDRGLTKVQFFDDDRVVCEVTAAPFNCAYQPRGGDVGRNTLVAVATDGAGQTTSAVRAISVRRFAAKDMTLALRPSRDRKAPYAFSMTGKITRPDPVSPSQGCSGTITFTAKKGTKVFQSKRVALDAHVRVPDDVLVQDPHRAQRPLPGEVRRQRGALRRLLEDPHRPPGLASRRHEHRGSERARRRRRVGPRRRHRASA